MYLDDTFRVKVGLAEMLKGGVIMDVTNAEQALIAEKAGATAVMALERVPSDIRKEGGVARMAPISKIREIMKTVSIPVMAKARIGHFMEARILEALGAVRADRVRGGARQASRAELLGGRYCDSGRRVAGDAARGGGGLRGIGHFQIR